MSQSPEALHIIPGYTCNLSCTHCATLSGPAAKGRLSQQEVSSIKKYISDYQPQLIQFTGGEPTLFPEIINDIIREHLEDGKAQIKITTNGWFTGSMASIQSTLSKILKIDFLQLSWDKFHGSPLERQNIVRLKEYCLEKNITFNISICISDPKDLIEAEKITGDLDLDIKYQRVSQAGRAKRNNITYQFKNFEESVLEKSCPGKNVMSYIPGKGWSTCCSNLTFNLDRPQGLVTHASAEEHLASSFYQETHSMNFGEIIRNRKMSNLNFTPNDSMVCNLCEKIYSAEMSV